MVRLRRAAPQRFVLQGILVDRGALLMVAMILKNKYKSYAIRYAAISQKGIRVLRYIEFGSSMFKSFRSFLPAFLAACGVSLGIAHSAPISLVNSDFEQGATGFTTDYSYDLVWLSAGEYYIAPADLFGWSNGVGDHTTGSGNMAMYNASSNAGDELWGQLVALEAGISYEFSVWVNLLNTGAPSLELLVGGVSVGTAIPSNITDIWQQVSFTFLSGIDGVIALSLINNNTSPYGVDFALDDLALASLADLVDSETLVNPIPGALPLFATGMALAGYFGRRRKAAAKK